MQEATIGTKHQVVIPLQVRKKLQGWRAGQKVKVYAPDNQTIVIKPEKKTWLEEGLGLMKEAWKDIDPIKELDKMRDEW